jgi:hypothetical protein
VDWIGLAQDRNRWSALVNSVLNLHVPRNAGKLSSGLSSSAQLHRVSYIFYNHYMFKFCVRNELLPEACPVI